MAASGKREIASRVLGSGFAKMLPSEPAAGLLVLAYHRIAEADPQTFKYDFGVVSASPSDFRNQMKFVRENFEVLSFADLNSLEQVGKKWPERALIVTFDDGYLDNYTNAFPILKDLGIPATIFLATNHIGKQQLFWWDLIAYCLKTTSEASAEFEEFPEMRLSMGSWEQRLESIEKVLRVVKRVSDTQKNCFVESLAERLGVDLSNHSIERMHLNWDEVREMSEGGVEFGSHSATHPVLSNVEEEALDYELAGSKREIENQTGKLVLAFSYPVGSRGNFTRKVRDAVERAGYKYAVSYIEALAGNRVSDRLAIPRVHVDADQPTGMFKANLRFPKFMLRERAPYSI